MLNNSAIWQVNTKPQNKQMHYRFSPRRTCNPCGYTMKISSTYHRLLNYDVKRTTKIYGMGPFKCLIKLRSLFVHHLMRIPTQFIGTHTVCKN